MLNVDFICHLYPSMVDNILLLKIPDSMYILQHKMYNRSSGFSSVKVKNEMFKATKVLNDWLSY